MPWPGALWSVAGPLGFSLRLNLRAAAAVVCVTWAAACAGPALAADGGSGTYVATGTTYYFDFVNSDTAAWQFFTVVGPPGTIFVGGTTANEQSARCVAGQPNGQANEIECGPLSSNVAPAHAHLSFAATLTATPPTWSDTPTRVAYRWQRCTAAGCSPLPGANTLTLALTRADVGRSVRLVATALVDSAKIVSTSKKLAVRAR